MRVQSHPDLVSGRVHLRLRGARGEQVGHPGHVRGRQHVWLREHQTVHRVVRSVVPVDELLDYIGVRPEREDRSYRANREPVSFVEPRTLREHIQMSRSVGTKPARGSLRRRHHLLDVSQPFLPPSAAAAIETATRNLTEPPLPTAQNFRFVTSRFAEVTPSRSRLHGRFGTVSSSRKTH